MAVFQWLTLDSKAMVPSFPAHDPESAIALNGASFPGVGNDLMSFLISHITVVFLALGDAWRVDGRACRRPLPLKR